MRRAKIYLLKPLAKAVEKLLNPSPFDGIDRIRARKELNDAVRRALADIEEYEEMMRENGGTFWMKWYKKTAIELDDETDDMLAEKERIKPEVLDHFINKRIEETVRRLMR